MKNNLTSFISTICASGFFSVLIISCCDNQSRPTQEPISQEIMMENVLKEIEFTDSAIDSLILFSSRNLNNHILNQKIGELVTELGNDQKTNRESYYTLKTTQDKLQSAVQKDSVSVELKNK